MKGSAPPSAYPASKRQDAASLAAPDQGINSDHPQRLLLSPPDLEAIKSVRIELRQFQLDVRREAHKAIRPDLERC